MKAAAIVMAVVVLALGRSVPVAGGWQLLGEGLKAGGKIHRRGRGDRRGYAEGVV